MSQVQVAIVGSGPAGLSAGARAAVRGLSHVVLERTEQPSNTIFRFQKGKHVMAQPAHTPLRSEIPFEDGRREDVLAAWLARAEELGVNFRFNSEVTGITGSRGDFVISLADGEEVRAETVVLAVGLQGNLNKLRVPGAELPHVGYQLDDPDEFEHERIAVIGGGDASIENALALAEHNEVTIINRSDEFARAKSANESAILAAIESGRMDVAYNANTIAIEPDTLVLETPEGEARIPCERIIARLGAAPPRKLVEACGVEFPTEERNALPEVSPQYESNVPGLYVVGALGGFPLIKQALNQGYEVIEHIVGEDVEPADAPLLREKISAAQGWDVDGFLEAVRTRVPIFAELNALVLRDTMLESEVHSFTDGEIVFRRNDYTNSLYVVIEGAVRIHLDDEMPPKASVQLGQGAFFGEMGLISGRRRNATVSAIGNALLLEVPRRRMITLRASVPSVREAMDREAVARSIQSHLAPGLDRDSIDDIAAAATIHNWSKGQVLFSEGEEGDSLHLIRRGSVLVRKKIGDHDVVLNYVAAGNYVGEMALVSGEPRNATVAAAADCETIRIERDDFNRLMDRHPDLRTEIEQVREARAAITARMAESPDQGSLIEFLVDQGGKEATDILLIDESLCVGCDNCEKACAGTHGGITRLDREAGPTYADMHVPTSCRHCEHPHCMSDCPPDAIKRAMGGEVYITDACIGCGNCQRNCPYDVIQMANPQMGERGWLASLLGGMAGKRAEVSDGPKQAVKCDMCLDIDGGPACVRACPTGAAIRVHPSEVIELVTGSGR
ncbi:MAG: cyclic nucleotide-binding domain-containing protein [Alphaproteobacteria bacterium]|nr:cyclic nucleotide-binding domain-containing protein [Alphaproteobacteria bacterium]